MKAGDRIKIKSARDDSYSMGTVIEVIDKSVKYKHDTISGYFVTLLRYVELAEL